jgi:poly [ADP-ribose] polymerase
LEEIEAYLKSGSKQSTKINELSSKFYTVVPQDFGRQRPPPIDDEEKLQKKYDMLVVRFVFKIKFVQNNFRIAEP